MKDALTYAPWVPREGMRGWYAHLVAHWGDPNVPSHRWPAVTLTVVCQRGLAFPIRVDRDCLTNTIYFLPKGSKTRREDTGETLELAPGDYVNPKQLGKITNVT